MTWEEAFRKSAKKYYKGDEDFLSNVKEISDFYYDKKYFDEFEKDVIPESEKEDKDNDTKRRKNGRST